MSLKRNIILPVALSIMALGFSSGSIYADQVDDLSIKQKDSGKTYELFDYMTNDSVFFDLITGSENYLVKSKGQWYEAKAAIESTQGNVSLEEAIKNENIPPVASTEPDEDGFIVESID